MSTLSKEQLALIAQANAKAIRPAKAKQARQARTRKGHCKPLPRSPLTPLAISSRWAQLAIGTEQSKLKTVTQTECRPKASLADRRLMRDVSNVSAEDRLYKIPSDAQMVDLFIEFLRVRKVRADRESATALEGRLNARAYRNLTRALKRGELARVTEILEQALNSNQVRP